MFEKSSESESLKPFWKMWWFWVLIALVVMQLPLFGDNADIPEELDQSFYYEAKGGFEDLMYGWMERETPGGISPEWIEYHYDLMQVQESDYNDKEKSIIASLHVMLQELKDLEEAVNQGETIEHYTFVDAARIVRDELQLPDEFDLDNY